jgi:hypothetical protein
MFNACLTPGCYSSSPLIKISSLDFELLTIVYENRDKLHINKHRFPKLHLSHHDYSTTPCKLSPLDSESLYPCDPGFGLATLHTLNLTQYRVPVARLFLRGHVSTFSIVIHETLERSYSSHPTIAIYKLLLLSFPVFDTVPHISMRAFFSLRTFADPLLVKLSGKHSQQLRIQLAFSSYRHNFSNETVQLSYVVG